MAIKVTDLVNEGLKPTKFAGNWDASTGAFPSPAIDGALYSVIQNGQVGPERYFVGDSIVFNGATWIKLSTGEEEVLMFDASTGSLPTDVPSGTVYIVSVAGTIATVDYAVGDTILFDGTQWTTTGGGGGDPFENLPDWDPYNGVSNSTQAFNDDGNSTTDLSVGSDDGIEVQYNYSGSGTSLELGRLTPIIPIGQNRVVKLTVNSVSSPSMFAAISITDSSLSLTDIQTNIGTNNFVDQFVAIFAGTQYQRVYDNGGGQQTFLGTIAASPSEFYVEYGGTLNAFTVSTYQGNTLIETVGPIDLSSFGTPVLNVGILNATAAAQTAQLTVDVSAQGFTATAADPLNTSTPPIVFPTDKQDKAYRVAVSDNVTIGNTTLRIDDLVLFETTGDDFRIIQKPATVRASDVLNDSGSVTGNSVSDALTSIANLLPSPIYRLVAFGGDGITTFSSFQDLYNALPDNPDNEAIVEIDTNVNLTGGPYDLALKKVHFRSTDRHRNGAQANVDFLGGSFPLPTLMISDQTTFTSWWYASFIELERFTAATNALVTIASTTQILFGDSVKFNQFNSTRPFIDATHTSGQTLVEFGDNCDLTGASFNDAPGGGLQFAFGSGCRVSADAFSPMEGNLLIRFGPSNELTGDLSSLSVSNTTLQYSNISQSNVRDFDQLQSSNTNISLTTMMERIPSLNVYRMIGNNAGSNRDSFGSATGDFVSILTRASDIALANGGTNHKYRDVTIQLSDGEVGTMGPELSTANITNLASLNSLTIESFSENKHNANLNVGLLANLPKNIDVIFRNLTVNFDSSGQWCFRGSRNITFEDCVITAEDNTRIANTGGGVGAGPAIFKIITKGNVFFSDFTGVGNNGITESVLSAGVLWENYGNCRIPFNSFGSSGQTLTFENYGILDLNPHHPAFLGSFTLNDKSDISQLGNRNIDRGTFSSSASPAISDKDGIYRIDTTSSAVTITLSGSTVTNTLNLDDDFDITFIDSGNNFATNNFTLAQGGGWTITGPTVFSTNGAWVRVVKIGNIIYTKEL